MISFLFSVIFINSLTISAEQSPYKLDVKGKIKGNLDVSAISCLHSELCLIASDETRSLQVISIKNNQIKS